MSPNEYPGYLSKEEKKIPIDDPSGKWSDLTLLPEWEEEFYDVYTVRKHGKWVMLKALKQKYADQENTGRCLRRNSTHAIIWHIRIS